MTKVELTNMVEVTYINPRDKDNFSRTFLTAMVHVPDEVLPPMSEEDKKFGGRRIDVYFQKAAEILQNEIGPINICSDGFRFVGDMTVVY